MLLFYNLVITPFLVREHEPMFRHYPLITVNRAMFLQYKPRIWRITDGANDANIFLKYHIYSNTTRICFEIEFPESKDICKF